MHLAYVLAQWALEPRENESESEGHYVVPVAENLALLESAPSFVRSTELDEYAAVGAPPEVCKEAFVTAN